MVVVSEQCFESLQLIATQYVGEDGNEVFGILQGHRAWIAGSYFLEMKSWCEENIPDVMIEVQDFKDVVTDATVRHTIIKMPNKEAMIAFKLCWGD